MKVCPCCKESKLTSEFGINKKTKDGLNCYCKVCAKEKYRIYREQNLDKVRQQKKDWKERNPTYKKEYYEKNSDRIKSRVKQYRDNNIELVREKDRIRDKKDLVNRRIYLKTKYDEDPMHKLKVNIRSRIGQYVKKNGIKTNDLIGCSYDDLKKHLESQFLPGMSWENHTKNGWHIDHHIPLSSAKTKEELYKLCNYTNLKPLWWNENLSKGDKISEEWGNESPSNGSI